MGPWLLPAIGAGGSILSSIFGSNSYSDAQKAAQQQFNQARGDMMPFINAGQGALGPLEGGAASLMNPEAMESQWINSYQESPYAKELAANATQSGMNAAESMGLGGSAPALTAITQGTGNIVSQDRQNYLNDLMNKYTTGLGTLRGIMSTGANLTGWMGEGGLAEQDANMTGNMTYGANQAPVSMMSRLMGGAMGYGLGGPQGAMSGMGMQMPPNYTNNYYS